jgi:hypothetical protein
MCATADRCPALNSFLALIARSLDRPADRCARRLRDGRYDSKRNTRKQYLSLTHTTANTYNLFQPTPHTRSARLPRRLLLLSLSLSLAPHILQQVSTHPDITRVYTKAHFFPHFLRICSLCRCYYLDLFRFFYGLLHSVFMLLL